jgi:hypothetical protein
MLTEEQMHDAAISKIGEVIWNHFYDSNPDMEEAHILEFARYDIVTFLLPEWYLYGFVINLIIFTDTYWSSNTESTHSPMSSL